MAKYLLILICLASSTLMAGSIEAIIGFDSSKLKEEKKEGASFFSYADSDVNYVEHGQGTPVLPCKHVYIAAPKGAEYSGCRTKISREQLPGRYDLYVRDKNAKKTGAELYPPSCVEFVKQYDEAGFRIFMFRVYPIMCQPADGTVMRIISLQMQVSCKGEERYENVPMDDLIKVKRKVLNPKALESLVASLKVSPKKGLSIEKEGFAVSRDKGRNVFAENAPKNKWRKDEAGPNSAGGDLIKALKQNNITIEDGSVMFSPIQF